MPLTQRSRLRATSLSGSRTPMGPSLKTRAAAQLLDGEFERELGAQRRLFEEQGDGFAREGAGVVAGRALDVGGEIEEVEQFVVGEIEIFEEIGMRRF